MRHPTRWLLALVCLLPALTLAQDITVNVSESMPTRGYGGWCATHTILTMLSARGVYHDFGSYHAGVLGQPMDYDYSNLARWKSWEQLDASVPEIVTVYTRDLGVIDDQLRRGQPVGHAAYTRLVCAGVGAGVAPTNGGYGGLTRLCFWHVPVQRRRT